MSPVPSLEGQKALVTGANSGIGKAVAIALGEAGADVGVNYLDGADAAAEVVETIRRSGRQSWAIQADVSREDEVLEMFRRLMDNCGTIDILVNNAGVLHGAAVADMTLAEWNAVIGVNLTGQFLCAREAIREFNRRGVVAQVSCSAGKIICISSVHELIPYAGHANYAASKGGVMLLMKSLALEAGPRRIRVNSICPGFIRTAANRGVWENPQGCEALMNLIPGQRIGEPEDIGRVAVFLASDQADYIHGASIFVDGGMALSPGPRDLARENFALRQKLAALAGPHI